MPLMRRSGLLSIVLMLCFMPLGFSTYSQTPAAPPRTRTGEIKLQVVDPSGAILRASGNIKGRGTDRNFQTDAHGDSSLSGLAFGTYQLKISSPGFASRTLTVDIHSSVHVSQTVTL